MKAFALAKCSVNLSMQEVAQEVVAMKKRLTIRGENLTTFKKALVKALAIALLERADVSLLQHAYRLSSAKRKPNANAFQVNFEGDEVEKLKLYEHYLRSLGFLDVTEVIDLFNQLFGTTDLRGLTSGTTVTSGTTG